MRMCMNYIYMKFVFNLNFDRGQSDHRRREY